MTTEHKFSCTWGVVLYIKSVTETSFFDYVRRCNYQSKILVGILVLWLPPPAFKYLREHDEILLASNRITPDRWSKQCIWDSSAAHIGKAYTYIVLQFRQFRFAHVCSNWYHFWSWFVHFLSWWNYNWHWFQLPGEVEVVLGVLPYPNCLLQVWDQTTSGQWTDGVA